MPIVSQLALLAELVTYFMLIKVFCVLSMLSKLPPVVCSGGGGGGQQACRLNKGGGGEQQASCGISTGTG